MLHCVFVWWKVSRPNGNIFWIGTKVQHKILKVLKSLNEKIVIVCLNILFRKIITLNLIPIIT